MTAEQIMENKSKNLNIVNQTKQNITNQYLYNNININSNINKVDIDLGNAFLKKYLLKLKSLKDESDSKIIFKKVSELIQFNNFMIDNISAKEKEFEFIMKFYNYLNLELFKFNLKHDKIILNKLILYFEKILSE